MNSLATTKLSSKGQVVIPESIRNQLGLTEGVQFIVLGQKDAVVLKTIAPPSVQDFDTLIAKARQQARRAHLKKEEIREAIKKVRRSR